MGFKGYFSIFVGHFLKRLPKLLNKYSLNTVIQHYKVFIQSDSFNLATASKHTISFILKNTKVLKVGLDNRSGGFLKNGAKGLAKLVTDLCNNFTDLCKAKTNK